MYLAASFFIYLFIFLFIYLFIYLSIYLFIHLLIYLYIYLFIYLSSMSSQWHDAISQIVAVLNSVALGHLYFQIALLLRESILVTKLVFTAEVWSKTVCKIS